MTGLRGTGAPVIERSEGPPATLASRRLRTTPSAGVSMNQAARMQFEHLCNGAEVALGGSFGDKRRAAVRNERVTNE